jgi:hypothetical protein
MIISLYLPITVTITQRLLDKVAMVEDIICYKRLHMSDVLHFNRTLAIRLNQPRMGNQVALVIKHEATAIEKEGFSLFKNCRFRSFHAKKSNAK